jgi:hypothetical protein
MTRVVVHVLSICLLASLVACDLKLRRPDQENLVLDTSKVPVEGFLNALSKRLSASWVATDDKVPDADPSKTYTLEAGDVTVVLEAIAHDRCNPNGSRHLTWEKAYRIDLVYRTTSEPERESAKRELLLAAADVGQRLTKFQVCHP